MITWLLLIVAGAGTLLLLARRRGVQPAAHLMEFHRHLVGMNLGDEASARRLVEAERKRNPMLGEVGCYRAAIARMRR